MEYTHIYQYEKIYYEQFPNGLKNVLIMSFYGFSMVYKRQEF